MTASFPKSLLLPLSLMIGLSGAAVAASSTEDSLRAEIADLQRTLVEKQAQLAALRKSESPAATQALALSVDEKPAVDALRATPSSTLSRDKARRAANAAHLMISGSSLMTVMPTGSMKPVFDENAVLMVEPASFDELKVGDIITYRHPSHEQPVVHRIIKRDGDRFWTQGDNNGRADEVCITRDNYEGRVFGMIFAKESAL